MVLARIGILLLPLLWLSACGGGSTGGKQKPNMTPYERGVAVLEQATIDDKAFREGVGHFNDALSKNPKDTKAMVGIATLYRRIGKDAEARNRYQAVLDNDPDSVEALSGLIALMLKDQQFDEARRLIEERLSRLKGDNDLPQEAVLRLTLGSLYLQEKKYPAAQQELMKVLYIDNFNRGAVLKLSYLYFSQGQRDRARLLLRNYMSNKVADGDAQINNLLGTIAIDEGKYLDAIDFYKKAITQDKGLLAAYLNLAAIYLKYNNYPAAEDICTQGLQIAKDNEDLAACAAISAVRQRKHDKAIPMLEALRKRSEKAEYTYELGLIYWQQDKLDDALGAFNGYVAETKNPDKAVLGYIKKIEQTKIDREEHKRKEAEQKRRAEEDAKRQAEEAAARRAEEEAEAKALAEEAAKAAAQPDDNAQKQAPQQVEPAPATPSTKK